MARIRRAWVAVGVGAVFLGLGPARGDEPVAPLNGTVAFPSAIAQSDTLYVDAGQRTVKATSARKFQGHADSRITITAIKASGQVHVATVVNRDGDSLYRVYGNYYADEAGGGGAGWKAEYNRGAGRVVLYVNSPAADDNYVGMLGPQVTTGTLTVTVGGAAPTADGYEVAPSKKPGSGDGEIGFRTVNKYTLGKKGGKDFHDFQLTGATAGELLIQGTAAGLATGETDATVTDISVAFNLNPIRTGYTLPLNTSAISRAVTATVTPPTATDEIVLEPPKSRAKIVGTPARDAEGGTIGFSVAGVKPSQSQTEEQYVEARYRGGLVGRARVLVLVPWSLVPVSTQGFENVQGVNHAADRTTSPAYIGTLAPDSVHLWTYYVVWQTITVRDQFGQTLDPVYAGQPVTETVGDRAINQNVTAQGTYQDPVGVVNNSPLNNLPRTDPRVATFLAGPPLPIPAGVHTQRIQVQIGGHPMHPGVRDRVVTSQDSPPRIQIQW